MAGDRSLLERCLSELEQPSGDTQGLQDALRKRLQEVDPGTTDSPPLGESLTGNDNASASLAGHAQPTG